MTERRAQESAMLSSVEEFREAGLRTVASVQRGETREYLAEFQKNWIIKTGRAG